jgi:Protein of unknown function (DUF3631)
VDYARPEDDGPADPEAIELAEQLLERCRPLTEDSPAWKFLTETRGLPVSAINYCSADLRELSPPIPGLDRLAYGAVSLLRNGTGDVTGLEITACGPGGEHIVGADGRTARKSFRLRDRGCAEGLFTVKPINDSAMIAYMAEGRLCKALAVAAVVDGPAAYGWGGRPSLGRAIPPEPSIVVIEDAPPGDPTEAERHAADYDRGCDRLALAGKMVSRATLGCDCCKDLDQAIRQHPLDEVRAWLLGAIPHELTLDGWARKCAQVKSPLKQGELIAEVIERHQLRRQGLTKAFRAQVAKYAGKDIADEDEAAATKPPVEDVLPWPHPVDGAEVLDEAVAAITRYVDLPLEAAHAAALWCAHSHGLDLSWFNPRLAICSPVKRCGKTILIEVLAGMVSRPKLSSGVTPAVVFRMIDKWHPTYLIDEADGYLPENEQLRSVLNSGHTKTAASVDRAEPNPDGTREPRSFSTWTPIVVAGIGRLPSTLDDRSIKIRLQRKPRSLKLTRFRADKANGISPIGRKLARFVLDNKIAIGGADIEPPEELHDRAADNWRPLLSLAEVAGGEWPERARRAALALEDSELAAEDLCVELLADVRQIFDAQKVPAKRETLFSSELLSALLSMMDRPWPEAGRNGRALTERGMADLLKPFSIRTHKTVRRDQRTGKGFRRAEFEDAFSKYLVSPGTHGSQGHNQGNPPHSEAPKGSHDGSHDGSHAESRPNGPVAPDGEDCAPEDVTDDVTSDVTHDVTHSNGPKAAENGHCDPVTHVSPERPPSARKKPRRRPIRGADTDPNVEGLD